MPHVGESGCLATAGPIVDRCVSNAASWFIHTNSVHWIDRMVWTSVTRVKNILSICVKSAKVWDSTVDRFIDRDLLLRHAHTHRHHASGEKKSKEEKQFISFSSNPFLIFFRLSSFFFFLLPASFWYTT